MVFLNMKKPYNIQYIIIVLHLSNPMLAGIISTYRYVKTQFFVVTFTLNGKNMVIQMLTEMNRVYAEILYLSFIAQNAVCHCVR